MKRKTSTVIANPKSNEATIKERKPRKSKSADGQRSEKFSARFTPEAMYILNKKAKASGLSKTAYVERLIYLDKMDDRHYDPRKIVKDFVKIQQAAIADREAIKSSVLETQEIIKSIPDTTLDPNEKSMIWVSLKALFDTYELRSKLSNQALKNILCNVPIANAERTNKEPTKEEH